MGNIALCCTDSSVLDSTGKNFTVETTSVNIEDCYSLDTQLGEGGFGVVYKGVAKSSSAIRAIKKMIKSKVEPNKLKQEVAIMKRLDHPYIIKLYETFEDSNGIYLVMELCTGGDLYDQICNDDLKLTEKHTAHIMKHVFGAVNYLHQLPQGQKICHRDIKAENFLFQLKGVPIEQNTLKLIDFGLSAVVLSRLTADDQVEDRPLAQVVGTPEYMAPEVVQGSYTYTADNWSCGVLLYEIMCGYTPFFAGTEREILAKIGNGGYVFKPEDWQNISEDCKNVISGLLKVNPRERLTAQEAMNHTWVKHNAPKSTGKQFSSSLVQNMRTFRSQNLLKKAALHVIAGQLDDKRVAALRDAFVGMDGNGDGTLTFKELETGLLEIGFKEIPADLKEIMADLDKDKSGMIDYTEFLAAALDKKAYVEEKACRAAFGVFDVNGDGNISRKELENVLAQRGASSLAASLKDIMDEVDENKDGMIDFGEFMQMMKGRSTEVRKTLHRASTQFSQFSNTSAKAES